MLKSARRYFNSTNTIEKIINKVGILGVPFEKGTNRPGVIHGPDSLRKAGLIDRLKEIGDLDIVDYGNLKMSIPDSQESPVESMLWLPQVSACNQALSPKVTSILNDGRVCVTLGGDHSIAIGSVDGHCQYSEEPAVFWIDAHADINTNATTPSRNLNGLMPLALLVKELKDYWPDLPTMEWLTPKLSIKNLAYIGLRSVDPYERLLMHKFNIPAFGMDDIQRYGIDAVLNLALQRVDPENTKSIHASFDIDALDALEAPSTTIPLRAGLTLREAIYTMEKLHDTERLHAIDIVELNPTVGSAEDVNKTIGAAMEVIKAGLGHQRKGIMPLDDDIPLPKVAEKKAVKIR